jgi:hypothetical protein
VLSSNDVAALKGAYHQPLYTIVSKVLTLLQARGLIFTPGKIGSNRYYGAVAILDPATVTLPNKQSRRRRALELVRGAVAGLDVQYALMTYVNLQRNDRMRMTYPKLT